jgi:hypothetical protein
MESDDFNECLLNIILTKANPYLLITEEYVDEGKPSSHYRTKKLTCHAYLSEQ